MAPPVDDAGLASLKLDPGNRDLAVDYGECGGRAGGDDNGVRIPAVVSSQKDSALGVDLDAHGILSRAEVQSAAFRHGVDTLKSGVTSLSRQLKTQS